MTDRELRILRDAATALRAIQQDIRSIRDQHERQGTQEQAPAPSPVINAELQFPERIERNNQSNSDREYRLHKWLTVGTYLAFLAAAIYAGIAYLQKNTMDNTLSEVHKQTQPVIDSAKAAQDAVKQARDQFRQDQRPYVWLTDNIGPFDRFSLKINKLSADRLVFNFHFTNYGKSPAVHNTVESHILIGPDAETRTIKWQSAIPDGGPILPTGKVDFNTAASDMPITEEFFKKVIAPGIMDPIVIRGLFRYKGIDGTSYSSEFCLGRGAAANIYYCKGNEIREQP